MADDVTVIEIVAQVTDKTDPGASAAAQNVSKMEKAMEKANGAADKMRRTGKIEMVVSAVDKASKVFDTAWNAGKRIAGKVWSVTLKATDLITAPIRGAMRMFTSLQTMILGAAGVAGGIIAPLNLSGDMEQTQMSFKTLLGSEEKAKSFMKEAETFAIKTPFELPEVLNSAKLSLAMGFKEEDIIPMLGTIGDTSAALGAGSEGIERMVRAMGQMNAKGRVQGEELLQLMELGVPAAEILQEELGLTANQVGNIGKAQIESGKVIEAILRGLKKRYSGLMDEQAKSYHGLLSTIKDTFQTKILTKWGDGLRKGIQPALQKVADWIDQNQDKITKWGEALSKVGEQLSTWFVDKLEKAQAAVTNLFDSAEFKNADTVWDKMKVAWDKLIAEPFDTWWNGSGNAWLLEKANTIGKGLGDAINGGLMAILGFSDTETGGEMATVGATFASAFVEALKPDEIGAAIAEAIKKGLSGLFGDAF